MVECVLCKEKISNGDDSTLTVSPAAEQALSEENDYRLEDPCMSICTGCIIQFVEDYLYTSQ